jgi:hypothetical protein
MTQLETVAGARCTSIKSILRTPRDSALEVKQVKQVMSEASSQG